MKKVLLSLVMIFAIAISMQAQELLKSGYIKMEITDASSENEQMAMALEMMKGTHTEIFFNNEKSLTKMSMMGGMVETTTLIDVATQKTDMLMNAMGQKMHVESTKAERDASAGENEEMMAKMKVTYDESDKKTILGYDCIKANFSHPDMVELSFSMYITKEIKANTGGIQMVQNLKFEGFPLEVTLNNPQMSMTIKAIELKKEVDPSVFTLDTGGFQKLSTKEFQDKMGGMGGMGF